MQDWRAGQLGFFSSRVVLVVVKLEVAFHFTAVLIQVRGESISQSHLFKLLIGSLKSLFTATKSWHQCRFPRWKLLLVFGWFILTSKRWGVVLLLVGSVSNKIITLWVESFYNYLLSSLVSIYKAMLYLLVSFPIALTKFVMRSNFRGRVSLGYQFKERQAIMAHVIGELWRGGDRRIWKQRDDCSHPVILTFWHSSGSSPLLGWVFPFQWT